jgi:hypothetical protein
VAEEEHTRDEEGHTGDGKAAMEVSWRMRLLGRKEGG